MSQVQRALLLDEEELNPDITIEYVDSSEMVESVICSPSPLPYHLLDHEYGQTLQNQIMKEPPNQSLRSQAVKRRRNLDGMPGEEGFKTPKSRKKVRANSASPANKSKYMAPMVETCIKCYKEFNHRSSLSRHLKEKHRSPDDITATNQYACALCVKKFKRKSHLQTHMNAVHCQGNELQCDVPKCNFRTVYKQVLARHLSSHKKQDTCPDKSYECNLCPKRYKLKSVLNYHLKKKHLVYTYTDLKTYKKVCPLCAFTVCNAVAKQTVKIMLKHFTEHHDVNIDYENLKFESVHEFKKWKSDLENEFNSRYTVTRTSKNNLRFTCHRNGIFTTKGCGKRSMKLKGSCKINGFCPASMTVNISDSGKVKVIFLKSHVGHENELKFVNLSEADKENIAESVANKIPNFLEERESFLVHLSTLIREKVTNFEELEAVINHCKPIPHIVNAIKTMPSSSVPVTVDKKPANSKIIQQRKFFSTNKRKHKGGVPKFSCEENNFVEVQLVMEEKSQKPNTKNSDEETTIHGLLLDHYCCTHSSDGNIEYFAQPTSD